MRLARLIILVGVLLAAMMGCDKSRGEKSAVVDQNYPALPPPAKVEHPASIDGRVVFAGKPPELSRLNTTRDPQCQKMHPDGLADESVVVSDDGGLANVIVYLKDAPRSDGSLQEPMVLDQVGCQYVPHVIAVQINQPLRIKSSDSVLHNVHILATNNPAENLSENGPGEKTVRFALPEMMHIRCDVHPWMKGVVGVFESPYFAVTGADGKFVIRGIPPGAYTLAAWHERFGEQTQKIVVGPDGKLSAGFSYAP